VGLGKKCEEPSSMEKISIWERIKEEEVLPLGYNGTTKPGLLLGQPT